MIVHILDVETTGLSPESDRVIEIASVQITSADDDKWTVGSPVSSFVNPHRQIPPEASGVNHIVDDDVVGAPGLGEAIDRVLTPTWPFLVDVVAAHQARFDRSFLPMLHEKRWIDTYRCCLHEFQDAPGFSNGVLFYYLNGKRPPEAQPHRAGFDVLMTAHILVRLLKERTVEELLKLSTKAVVLKKVGFGKHFGQLWTEVPDSYLAWASTKNDLDVDVRFTVKHEINRRAGARQEQAE